MMTVQVTFDPIDPIECVQSLSPAIGQKHSSWWPPGTFHYHAHPPIDHLHPSLFIHLRNHKIPSLSCFSIHCSPFYAYFLVSLSDLLVILLRYQISFSKSRTLKFEDLTLAPPPTDQSISTRLPDSFTNLQPATCIIHQSLPRLYPLPSIERLLASLSSINCSATRANTVPTNIRLFFNPRRRAQSIRQYSHRHLYIQISLP
jgi:hypothetical protein